MSPQAGWYADPTDAAAVRWWDGAQWSTETRPVPRELAMAGASAPAPAVAAAPSAPTPTLAAVTPTLAPQAAPAESPTPQIVRPESTPSLADRSRPAPRTMAATPPPPRVAPPETPDEVPYPQAATPTPAPAAAPAQPRSQAAPPWVDSSSSAPAINQFGSPVNASSRVGAQPSGFGAPVPSSHIPGSDKRHWGKILTIGVLIVAVVGGVGYVALPRVLAARDASLAATEPDVLARKAPATLAGAHRASSADQRAKTSAAALVSQGAGWAWSGSYGSRASTTSYVASDVPLGSRADAVRALSSRGAALALMSALANATVAGGGSLVTGTPTEYASPVGGKTWCMPVTAGGVGGGFCAWTNGKEELQVLSTPGLEQTAAKSTLAALAQLAQISTRHTSGS